MITYAYIYIYIHIYIYAYVIIHIYIYIQWFFMQQKSNELENWTLWYVFTIDNHLNIWIRDCNPKISLRTENHDPCSSINPKLMVVHSYWKFSWSPQLARWGIFSHVQTANNTRNSRFRLPIVGPAQIPNLKNLAPELIHGNVHPRTRFTPNFRDRMVWCWFLHLPLCGR